MNIALTSAWKNHVEIILDYLGKIPNFEILPYQDSTQIEFHNLLKKLDLHLTFLCGSLFYELKEGDDLHGLFKICNDLKGELQPFIAIDSFGSLDLAILSDAFAPYLSKMENYKFMLSDVLNFELRDMLKAAELASLKDDKTIDLLHAKFTDHMRKEEGFLSAHSYRKQREIEAGYDQTRNNQAVLAGTPVENPQRTWMDDMYPVLIGVDPIRENPPVVMLNSSLTDIGDHKVEEGQVVQEFTIKLPKTDLPDGKVIVTVLTKDTQITDGAPRDFNDPLVQKFFTSNKE